eukprot:118938-Rhodomonas_salina.3
MGCAGAEDAKELSARLLRAEQVAPPIILRTCYAMSGARVAYAAMRLPVLTERNAMSGTRTPYAAMRSPGVRLPGGGEEAQGRGRSEGAPGSARSLAYPPMRLLCGVRYSHSEGELEGMQRAYATQVLACAVLSKRMVLCAFITEYSASIWCCASALTTALESKSLEVPTSLPTCPTSLSTCPTSLPHVPYLPTRHPLSPSPAYPISLLRTHYIPIPGIPTPRSPRPLPRSPYLPAPHTLCPYPACPISLPHIALSHYPRPRDCYRLTRARRMCTPGFRIAGAAG